MSDKVNVRCQNGRVQHEKMGPTKLASFAQTEGAWRQVDHKTGQAIRPAANIELRCRLCHDAVSVKPATMHALLEFLVPRVGSKITLDHLRRAALAQSRREGRSA